MSSKPDLLQEASMEGSGQGDMGDPAQACTNSDSAIFSDFWKERKLRWAYHNIERRTRKVGKVVACRAHLSASVVK